MIEIVDAAEYEECFDNNSRHSFKRSTRRTDQVISVFHDKPWDIINPSSCALTME
jgi:hypothetical protein